MNTASSWVSLVSEGSFKRWEFSHHKWESILPWQQHHTYIHTNAALGYSAGRQIWYNRIDSNVAGVHNTRHNVVCTSLEVTLLVKAVPNIIPSKINNDPDIETRLSPWPRLSDMWWRACCDKYLLKWRGGVPSVPPPPPENQQQQCVTKPHINDQRLFQKVGRIQTLTIIRWFLVAQVPNKAYPCNVGPHNLPGRWRLTQPNLYSKHWLDNYSRVYLTSCKTTETHAAAAATAAAAAKAFPSSVQRTAKVSKWRTTQSTRLCTDAQECKSKCHDSS